MISYSNVYTQAPFQTASLISKTVYPCRFVVKRTQLMPQSGRGLSLVMDQIDHSHAHEQQCLTLPAQSFSQAQMADCLGLNSLADIAVCFVPC